MKRCAGPFAARLVVMVKAPRCGLVKTRLARTLGAVAAAAFYRHATSATVARIGRDRRWRTLLAVAPDADVAKPFWPRHLQRKAQGDGDLGRRMQRVFDVLPPGPVVVVGSDVPGIRPSHVAAAFRALGSHDAVFGPAPDGGYWLIGLRRRPRVPRAFRGVRWSHEQTLADNVAALAGLRIARIATLADVDVADDLDGTHDAGRVVCTSSVAHKLYSRAWCWTRLGEVHFR